MEVTYSEFHPRRPWLGADLQTLRNRLRRPLIRPLQTRLARQAEILEIPLPHSPGDRLRAGINAPDRLIMPKPMVLLIHGLTGCESSDNIVSSAWHFLKQGHPVARLNLRGAGPGAALAESMYHAGLTDDLRAVIAGLKKHPLAGQGLVAMGVSLGGNMLLKYLGEAGMDSGLRAAVSVSAPISLKLAQRRIETVRNFIYHRVLLHDMLQGLRSLPRMLEPLTDFDFRRIQRIYDFDNLVVAGFHGYRDADHYYRENSACAFLGAIRTPTLMIQAQDDPWIPFECYQALPANPALTPLFPRRGGHVGFHGKEGRQPWHDRQAARFFESCR